MTKSDILEKISLRPYNTFGIDVTAEYLLEFKTTDQLRQGLEWSYQQNQPSIILGGGSNVLLTRDYQGIVLINKLSGIKISHEDDDHVWVKAAGGEKWHELVMHTVDQRWGGIENLSLIPGSVGAAPMQNIGAYGVEIKDVFVNLEAMNMATLEVETFDNNACEFGYRDSVFKRRLKDKYVILNITLKLAKQPMVNVSYGAIKEVLHELGVIHPSIKDVSNAVIAIRNSKLPDPAIIGNAGSFFKNPVVSATKFRGIEKVYPDIPSYPQPDDTIKVPAGWLIEEAGWKGRRHGSVGVHSKQALVLVNYGGAKGGELIRLARDVQASVQEQFGIGLEMEVNIY